MSCALGDLFNVMKRLGCLGSKRQSPRFPKLISKERTSPFELTLQAAQRQTVIPTKLVLA
jgi:hypothetical protein